MGRAECPGSRTRSHEPEARLDADAGDDRIAPGRWWGLILGLLLFLGMLLFPAPEELSTAAWRTAAVAVLMAVWWTTEAIPIPATALLPLVLFPALDVLSMTDAAEPYANELIFLFMGGFFLAAAMERWGLHRRIALRIVAAVGTGPERLVLGFMIATGFLSMWISNTATAAMMLPIGLAMVAIFVPADGAVGGAEEGGATTPPSPFGTALMLGIAYGASIGGVATLIGTPPNAILAGAAQEMLGVEIGFLSWMLVGLPVAALLMPLAWLLLVRVLYPPGPVRGDAGAVLEQQRDAQGPMDRGERIVAVVFALTALAWVLRAPKDVGAVTVPGLQTLAPAIRDSTIAIAAALLLFLLPVDRRRGVFALEWEQARKIPWGVLVLFGGGLSLARAMDTSGLATWIGTGVTGLAGVPDWVLFLSVAALFVALTEITSNTATSTMAMPIMAGAAVGLGTGPVPLMATAALAASMAFMLPVATPPNAIVFASEHVTIPRMARAGIWLNILAVATITVAVTLLVPHVLPGP